MSDTKLPPAASRSGKNAYYIQCPVVEHSAAYCACLDKLQKIRDKAPSTNSLAACEGGLRTGRCQAAGMEQAELLHGEAIYFVARETLATKPGPAWSYESKPAPKVLMPPKPPTAQGVRIDTGGYSDAINAAVRATPAQSPVAVAAPIPVPPAAPVARVSPPAMVAGESPIQYARRIAATR